MSGSTTWLRLIGGTAGLVAVVATTAWAGPAPKVTVCHLPNGDADKEITITVGSGAEATHIGHGDTYGPCPSSP